MAAKERAAPAPAVAADEVIVDATDMIWNWNQAWIATGKAAKIAASGPITARSALIAPKVRLTIRPMSNGLEDPAVSGVMTPPRTRGIFNHVLWRSVHGELNGGLLGVSIESVRVSACRIYAPP